jgi:hypothetical protein
MPISVEILAILSRSLALLRDFRFAAIGVSRSVTAQPPREASDQPVYNTSAYNSIYPLSTITA